MAKKTPKGMGNFNAKSLYKYLDERIVGQNDAKKLTAIAFASHFLRQEIKDQDLKNAIVPKNMLFFGPTGVGKTEIARCLASYSNIPFIKIDITTFTEVGYAGNDVDTIVKDLINQEVQAQVSKITDSASSKSKSKIAKKIALMYLKDKKDELKLDEMSNEDKDAMLKKTSQDILLEKMHNIEISIDRVDLEDFPDRRQIFVQQIDFQHGDEIDIIPLLEMKVGGKKKNKVQIGHLFQSMLKAEVLKAINDENVVLGAIKRIESGAIVFIDEIDKIISPPNSIAKDKGSVSKEGVQRGLLAIIEGTNVLTKYGVVNTKNILFIAAGAFSDVKPTDLMPELQGRLPVKVKLNSLTVEDFIEICSKIKFNLISQYKALAEFLNVELVFTQSGVKKIAELSHLLNANSYDIGTRRLYGVFEKILEDVFFEDVRDSLVKIEIDEEFVLKAMSAILKKENIDTGKFVL